MMSPRPGHGDHANLAGVQGTDRFASGYPGVDPGHIETVPFPRSADAPLDVWDLARAPDGRVFASLSPMHEPGAPQLYRLDAKGTKLELVFDLKALTFLARETIPASKIHTSMAFVDDDTLLMVSHTTAPAPGHDVWAPLSCYHDLYEGFQGSHMLRLDLRTGDARSLGIPVPRESLWGGSCYLARSGEYLAIGLMRGHLYAIRVADMEVTDLGFVGRGCRLFHDDAGNAYGISPVGRDSRGIMYRYDPTLGRVDDLDVDLPNSGGASLAFARRGPDGRIYFVRNFYDPFWELGAVVDDETTDHLFAFNPADLHVEDLGPAFPGARDLPQPRAPIIPRRIIVGPTFLDDGNLYYGVLGGTLDGLVALMRWDVVGGGEPEFLGYLHDGARAVPFVWDSVAGPDGRLYFAEASAGVFSTRPELIAVDASELAPPEPRTFSLSTRFSNPPGFDAEVKRRKSRYAQMADPHIGPRRVRRICLHDHLLGPSDCAVADMATLAGTGLCIATCSGAVALWNGSDAWIAADLDEPVCGLAWVDGHLVVASTRTLWRLAPNVQAGRHFDNERLADLPEPERFTFLGARGGAVFGLMSPGETPFALTGSGLVRGHAFDAGDGGSTVLWQSDTGDIFGARRDGEIYCWRPGERSRGTGAYIPSSRGRRFLARWTAACTFGAHMIGGTSDGCLFEYEPGEGAVRDLGRPALSLGIRALATDGERIVGIAGRAGDLCTIFGWSPRGGFVDYGTDVTGTMDYSALVCLADGKVAVAEAGRIAHVNVYDLSGLHSAGKVLL